MFGSNFSQQPFGYSSKRSDFSSGLVYFGYRFYMPNLGRWLNRDPLQEQGEINLYAYVNGDPMGYVDPDGLNFIPVGDFPKEAYMPLNIVNDINESEEKADKKAKCDVAEVSGAILDFAALYPPFTPLCTAVSIALGHTSRTILQCE